MGLYDRDDYDYNCDATARENQRQAEQQAQRQADYEYNRREYGGNNNGGGDWHIDAICSVIGFTDAEANIIKCEYDSVFQGIFGGNPRYNSPEQYQSPRSTVRSGDPKGVTGFTFSVIRGLYFTCEHIPALNNLQLWAFVDSVVLRNSTNAIVSSYLEAVKQGVSPKTAQ